jgi:DNA-binding HxlR family transcriptional regulator
MTEPRRSAQSACTCAGQLGPPPQVAWTKAATDKAENLRALQDAQRLFDGEWTSAILVVLSDGPKHYKQIRDRIHSLILAEYGPERPRRVLHDSVLTRSLKSMTAKKLIERNQISASFPPAVQYSLTTATAEALSAWGCVINWARKHSDLVGRVRSFP